MSRQIYPNSPQIPTHYQVNDPHPQWQQNLAVYLSTYLFPNKMSSPNNTYSKHPPSKVNTKDDDNILMRDNSPSSKDSGLEELKQETKAEHKEGDSSQNHDHQEDEKEINFNKSHFQIPPSFNCLITEEMLCDNERQYIF